MSETTQDPRLAPRQRPTDRSPAMYQQWRELLFLHWEYDPAVIQQTLPPGLTVDTFEGRAFLGVVPFFMRGIRPRLCPAVPGISNFLEMNLRTYVLDDHGVPGVWFYSLDANQWLAVRLARTFFHLPYQHARMQAKERDGFIEYKAQRKGTPDHLQSRFTYRAGKELGPAHEGSLEFFLTERYILFAFDAKRSRLYSGQVAHIPYPLCEAEVETYTDTLLELADFSRTGRAPEHAIMSRGVDVEVFGLQRVSEKA